MPANPLGKVEKVFFCVETTWPDSSRPEKENEFGSYYAYAYTDIRDPGTKPDKMVINTQKEIFDKRCSSSYGALSESLKFPDENSAKRAANFLQKWGRMNTGWDKSSQEIHQKKYRGPLKVRIVKEYNLNIREEIDFVTATPADDYEIELAALKKKYGKE